MRDWDPLAADQSHRDWCPSTCEVERVGLSRKDRNLRGIGTLMRLALYGNDKLLALKAEMTITAEMEQLDAVL